MLPIPPQSPAGLGRQRTQQRREAGSGWQAKARMPEGRGQTALC